MVPWVVFGDLNVDVTDDAPLAIRFDEFSTCGGLTFGNLRLAPGGSAYNFCKNLLRYCDLDNQKVTVCGAIGLDDAGELLANHLRELGLACKLQTINKVATGCAIILWDSSQQRVIINNSPNANMQWWLESGAETTELIRGKNVFLSGYCLIGTNYRAQWWQANFDLVRKQGRRLILDVVPHRIHGLIDKTSLKKYIFESDLVVSEVSTLRRVLDLGNVDETVTDFEAIELSSALMQHGSGKFVLRFGASGCDKQLLCRRGEVSEIRSTGHSIAAQKLGYGDELLVKTLIEETLEHE